MKILELFSGTGSFSNVAKERGHEVFTVDIDGSFNPSLTIDIMDLTPQMILDKFGKPDVIWASPPCTTFSVASIYRYWKDGKPSNEKTLRGIEIVKKTIAIIKLLNPKYFIIENPRGMLRKQEFMFEFKRDTVSYCQYGDRIMKPTDIWNNISSFSGKICRPKAPCHERASRGAKKGVQGIYNAEYGGSPKNRAIVPKQLCEEILMACEFHVDKKDVTNK
jgi:site-specific DNA-cytosine methylase